MFVKIDPNALLTPEDTADMLGVSTSTLARWRHEGGELKFVRLSRQTVKHRYADIAAFIEERLRA
jgi:excisionase family DNA binding protein